MAKYLLCVLLLGIYTPASAHDPGMTVATVIAEEHETSVELSVKGSDLELITCPWRIGNLRTKSAA
jgi:hypothetical protein